MKRVLKLSVKRSVTQTKPCAKKSATETKPCMHGWDAVFLAYVISGFLLLGLRLTN